MLNNLFVWLLALQLSHCAYNEKYRPQFHFSPPKGWMNDPNGLVYNNGSYELFYQYYPDKGGGPKYWGHARSTDMFHWHNLPVALSPQKSGAGQVEMYSGSAIVDTRNVSGFQAHDNPNKTMLAFFTGHYNPGSIETQWMAYSTDNGINWKYYDKNPVIPNPGSRDFRDPKVLEFSNHYVIIVTAGNRVRLYNSTDLKNWLYMSEFGADQGSHSGVWECCDLFPLNHKNQQKWVLAVNNGGLTQYFVGSFDGQSFLNDNSKETTLYVDYGPDSYAGVTYNSVPDNRRVFMSWLPGPGYADRMPTDPWRGVMSLPRELTLVDDEGKLRLSSLPVKELSSLFTSETKITERRIEPNSPITLTDIASNLLDIQLIVNLNNSKDPKDKLGLEFRGAKDSLRVYFTDKYEIDRSNAGRHDFGPYSLTNSAPRLTKSQILDMRIVLDKSSVELFADNGLSVMTALFFSDDKLNENIKVFYETSNVSQSKALDFKLYVNQLKRVWS